MRFFDAGQVHRSLAFPALADAIADMLRARPAAPLRHAHALSADDTLLLMPAWSDGDAGALGVKLVTVMPGNRERGLGTVNSTYLLFDRASGAPRALIDGDALTLRRTAAASLLAARHLARADAANVLVVGTGRLAPFMARAHCAERAVKRLWIWGRRGEGSQTLAQMLRDEGLPAQAVDDLEQAVRDADIVSCATTATAPIVHGAWLAPGCHLDLVGGFRRSMREADDAAVARARVFVDTYAGALAEAADIVEPIERGVIGRADVLGELAGLVDGTTAGRRSADDITLFKSVGTAIEDLAAARLLLQVAGDDG
jgi:ornithine cyclodeaminase